MKVSLNEIQAMARKATFGSGLAFGLAEEAGLAVRLLSRSGLPAVEGLAGALEIYQRDNIAYPPEQRAEGGDWFWTATDGTGMFCPLIVGPSLADSIAAADETMPRRIMVRDVVSPMLLPGFLAPSGFSLRVTWNDGTALLSGGRIRQYRSPAEAGPPNDNPTTVNIEFIEHGAQHTDDDIAAHWDSAPEQGVEVDTEAWLRLEAIAANILVPDNEISRTQGAGAGLVDTD